MRVIDADALYETIDDHVTTVSVCPTVEWARGKTAMKEICLEDIQNAPTVDAVLVVRCKDCRYAHMTYNGECKYCDFWQEDGGDALYLDGDFYCAAGERKDGGENDDAQTD